MNEVKIMKAAVLQKTGEPLRVEEGLEVPDLLPGQVLIKMAYSSICHSQLMEIEGLRGNDRYLPHLLGHEGSGHVVGVGMDVHKVKPGDAVVVGWIKGEGLDAGGVVYQKNGQKINAGPCTTLSEYSIISENRCVKIPEEFPLDIAALFGCVVPTGVGMILNHPEMDPGGSIAIIGMGGVGLCALMAAKSLSMKKVIAVDIDKNKLVLAKELGADHVVDARETDVSKAIGDITDNIGVKYCIEAAGTTSTIEQAFSVIHKTEGICIFASHPENGAKIRLDPHELICGKRIMGSWGGWCNPDRDIPRFISLYKEGKLPLQKLISGRYRLDDINQVVSDFRGNKIIKALIEF